MLFCPESPRWLARQDNFEAAEKIIVKLRQLPADHPYVVREIREIRLQVEERSTLHMGKKQQFKKLFAKGVRNRMGIGMALMFLQSFTGVNIITYYSPRILYVSLLLSPLTSILISLVKTAKPSALPAPAPSSSARVCTAASRPWA